MSKFYRKRLKPVEAAFLGFKVREQKESEKGYPRYMLSKHQVSSLEAFRLNSDASTEILNEPNNLYLPNDTSLCISSNVNIDFTKPTNAIKPNNNNSVSNRRILVIGDLHEPFCLDGYLEFCKSTYDKYNCNHVIFIGDVIDNHYSSYHETDPEGSGGADELRLAKAKIARWAQVFPVAEVIIGNHDRLIMRKAQTSNIPREWIKEYKEVLNTPGWTFTDSVEYDDVKYVHGEGGTAKMRIKADMQSVVQGHLHTQCYTEWLVGNKFKVFGSQVGCGVDHKSYAMGYAKAGKKPAIGCMVVLDGGKTPINILMDL